MTYNNYCSIYLMVTPFSSGSSAYPSSIHFKRPTIFTEFKKHLDWTENISGGEGDNYNLTVNIGCTNRYKRKVIAIKLMRDEPEQVLREPLLKWAY